MFFSNLSLFHDFMRSAEDMLEGPLEFIHEHHQNPVLWLAFFFLGIFVFNATYNALEKDK